MENDVQSTSDRSEYILTAHLYKPS